MFLGSKAFQDSLGRPKKAPKRHQKNPNTFKKTSTNGPQHISFFDKFWDYFGDHFGVKNVFQNWTKNGTTLGTLSLRLSGVG